MLKKLICNLLTCVIALGLVMACAPAASAVAEAAAPCDICNEIHDTIETHTDPSELRDLMSSTYKAALKKSGLRSFYNRCSTLVNTTLLCLGITNTYMSCHGKGEYDLFTGMAQTDAGYKVTQYSAKSYGLKGALNAISENGTKDVYNIVLGWQSGTGSASRYYGHTCFIYAILDGVVYYIDNFGMTIGGKYYKAGQIVTCTIDQFAASYNAWARFEGAVHFEQIDNRAPTVSSYASVSDQSAEGFTLTWDASDDIGISSIYAKVQISAEDTDNYRIVCGTVEDGVATVRINTTDFDGYQGDYYVTCYTGDGSNQPATTAIQGGAVSLYTPEELRCYYRVSADLANLHAVPQSTFNGQSTKSGVMMKNTIRLATASYVNLDGETWLQLDSGDWVQAHLLTEDLEIPKEWPDFIIKIFNWILWMQRLRTV